MRNGPATVIPGKSRVSQIARMRAAARINDRLSMGGRLPAAELVPGGFQGAFRPPPAHAAYPAAWAVFFGKKEGKREMKRAIALPLMLVLLLLLSACGGGGTAPEQATAAPATATPAPIVARAFLPNVIS